MLNLLKIWPRGSREIMNKRGPWTEPWGTPVMTGSDWDFKVLS
jgi:hypothetical protein